MEYIYKVVEKSVYLSDDSAHNDLVKLGIFNSTEENNAITNMQNSINTYASEMFFKFIMGEEPLSGFDAYREQLKSMGFDTVLQIKQQQVDRYFAR